MIDYLHASKKQAHISRASTPTQQNYKNANNLNLRHKASTSSLVTDTPPRSRSTSPSRSSSSLSTTSTHTAVPSYRPNGNANGAVTPTSRTSPLTSTMTPLARAHELERESNSTSTMGRIPAAPSIDEDVIRIRPTRTITLLKNALGDYWARHRYRIPIMILFGILLPILLRLRSARWRRVAVSSSHPTDASAEARRRLEAMSFWRGIFLSRLWSWIWKAVVDTIVMAGRGLL